MHAGGGRAAFTVTFKNSNSNTQEATKIGPSSPLAALPEDSSEVRVAREPQRSPMCCREGGKRCRCMVTCVDNNSPRARVLRVRRTGMQEGWAVDAPHPHPTYANPAPPRPALAAPPPPPTLPLTSLTLLPPERACSCARLSALSRQLAPPSPTRPAAGTAEGGGMDDASGAAAVLPSFIMRRPKMVSGSACACACAQGARATRQSMRVDASTPGPLGSASVGAQRECGRPVQHCTPGQGLACAHTDAVATRNPRAQTSSEATPGPAPPAHGNTATCRVHDGARCTAVHPAREHTAHHDAARTGLASSGAGDGSLGLMLLAMGLVIQSSRCDSAAA